MTYNFFTTYYDEIVRGNGYSLDDEISLIIECIENFWNNWKTILEFASGTGVVAQQLQEKWYKVYGVDMSETMLQKAKKLIWTKNCKQGDMTQIDVWKEYDVVLCNYNSVCHLTSWKEWQAFFKNAYKHLKTWWVLIFDINTVSEFESITRDFAQFYSIGDDTVCLEMKKENGIYEWIVRMFIKNVKGTYDLHVETIPELSFEIPVIQKELENIWFKNLHIEDFHKWKVDSESERVYFIAKKND